MHFNEIEACFLFQQGNDLVLFLSRRNQVIVIPLPLFQDRCSVSLKGVTKSKMLRFQLMQREGVHLVDGGGSKQLSKDSWVNNLVETYRGGWGGFSAVPV